LLTYTIAQLFVNYIVRSYQRSQSIVRSPTLPCAGGATIISRPPLLFRAHHYYRSSVTVIDRPPLLSIAVPRQSRPQLINNDNRCWWESPLTADSPTLTPYLIIIII